MQKAFSSFVASFLVALGVGILLSSPGQTAGGMALLVLLGIFAVFFQTSVTGSVGFRELEAQGKQTVEQDDEGFFYCGAVLERENLEDKALISSVVSADRMGLRYLAIAALMGVYVLCLHYVPSFGFHKSHLLHWMCFASIVFAFSPGHFLVALALNVLNVWFSFHLLSGIPRSFGVPTYLFLVVLVFHFYRLMNLEVMDSKADFLSRDEKRREVFVGSLKLFATFGALLIVCDRVIPETQEIQKLKQSDQSSAVGFDEELLRLNRSAGRLKKVSSGSSSAIRREDALSALEAARKLSELKSSQAGASQLTLKEADYREFEEKLKRDLAKDQADSDVKLSADTLEAFKHVTSASSPENTLAHAAQSGSISQEDALKALETARKLGESASSQAESESQEPLKKADYRDLEEKLKQDLANHQAKHSEATDVRLSSETIDSLKRVTSASPAGDAIKTLKSIQPVERKERVEQKTWMPEEKLKRIIAIVKNLTVLAAFFALAIFISHFLKKKKSPEELNESSLKALDREERVRLRREWSALSQASLSPREEVIEKYHFFLNVMEAVGQPKPDSLPPREFARDLRRVFPWIAAPSESVTETFSDVFYGLQIPELKTLQEFRAQLERIRAQFI